jgi:long-chain fatty acid transport protein
LTFQFEYIIVFFQQILGGKMKQKGTIVRVMLSVVLVIMTGVSLPANGLNLNGIGSRAIAMGGAFIGLADDYSAVFWNPAGLAQMEKSSLSFFVTDLIPSGTYKFSLYGIDTKTQSAMYPSGSIAFYKPINEKLVIGLAAYVPSGIGAKWDGEDLKLLSNNLVFKWESFMGVITVSPVIAYKINDMFSLGATLNLNYGMLKIKRPGFGQYNEDLSGFAVGATFGALIKPIDRLGVGLTLRLPTKVTFKGDATITAPSLPGVPLPALPLTSDAEREATWPLWLGVGFSFKATDKLIINADAQYTNWKKIDTIPVTYSEPVWEIANQIKKLTNNFELNWKDAIQWRFGLEYAISEKLAMRAGYYYDPSPSPVETLTVLLPEITYNVATVGIGYKSEKMNLDFCMEVLMGKDQESPLTGKMPGMHGMSILVPNIAFTFYL